MNSTPRRGERPDSGPRPHRRGAVPFGLVLLAIGLLTVGLFTTACGQRGPLFLPDEKTTTPPAEEIEKENVENSPNLQEEEEDDEEMPGA